jgi:hypothetical protein
VTQPIPIGIDAARLSVNDPRDNPSGMGASAPMLWMVGPGPFGRVPPAWGSDIYGRDAWLQSFLDEEPYMGSAVASIASRNAAYSWSLEGPEAQVMATKDLLDNASYGAGWVRFAIELTYNLLSQDTGAFVETIRSGPNPTDPLVSLAVLPSQQCYATGDPEYPVVFRDRRGRIRKLGWWQAIHLLEMPKYHRTYPALQSCAVTRALKQAQIWYGIQTYIEEKANGRFARAAHVISGITRKELESAITLANSVASAEGLTRYKPPVLIPSLQDHAPAIATLELASLPDGFDLEQQHRQYLTILAMAFLCEFQDFAPLPSGNIGTGTQSDTLDQKARLKGAAIWRKLIAQMINQIIPEGVVFTFDEQDVDEEFRQAEVRDKRATARQKDVAAGVLDAVAGREIMLADGDLTQEQFDALLARDAQAAEVPAPDVFGEVPPPPPAESVPVGADTNPMGNDEGSAQQKGILPVDAIEAERLQVEDDATAIHERMLTRMWRRLTARMAEEV